ncbi:MAG: DUF6612 family protein [Frisingicoccus sp.]|uniref:DUF6612 family protein n=1 Tax=Frisingicoccus sp. TaxID=1918627 RepID=UPI0025BA9E13|nr:DUF6612 family protein [Frisingicoccus sp.]MDY4835808.1 DUF6612 family protein [Frisingicoccus sp.]
MRKKLVWVLVASIILSSAALGGCGKKEVTAESIVQQSNETMEKAKSFLADFNMEMEMSMSSGDQSMDMDMAMTGTMQATQDPEIVYMDVAMTSGLFGLSLDMDIYTQTEEDKVITYTGIAGEWMKTEQEGLSKSNLAELQKMFGSGKEMTLAEQTEKIGDKEVYVLTASISGEELEKVMSAMGSMANGLDSMDLSQFQADTCMKVYKDTMLPASITLDMITNGEGMEVDGVVTKINKMTITVDYKEFDTIDSIEIPAEALAAETIDANELLQEAETSAQ